MKKYIRKLLDKAGITLFRNSTVPIGTDYRKNIRNLYGEKELELVFDIGANIGQFCIHFNEIFDKTKVFSFEPVSYTFDTLQKNTDLIKNINCYNLAMGEKAGSSKIYLRERSDINSLLPSNHENENSEMVEVETVDSFCVKNSINKIDLLKIDTEGYEMNVLKGAKKMIQNKAIKYIFIEVSFDKNNKHNTQFDLINNFLEKVNYKIFGIYNQSIHDNSSFMNYCDILYILDNKKN